MLFQIVAALFIVIVLLTIFSICGVILKRYKNNCEFAESERAGHDNVNFFPPAASPPSTVPSSFYTMQPSRSLPNSQSTSLDPPPAYSETPIYSTTSSGMAPNMDLGGDQPPQYQSFLNQSISFDPPSMQAALWTSSRTSISNTPDQSTRRITSWDSARGDSIESRRTDYFRSSCDQQPELTLGPLDERIEMDLEEEGDEMESLSGQWLEGVNMNGKKRNARKTSSDGLKRINEPLRKATSRRESARNRHGEGSAYRRSDSQKSSRRRKGSTKQQTSSRNQQTSKGCRKGIRNEGTSYDSGLDSSNDNRNTSRSKQSADRRQHDNAAFVMHHTDV